MSSRPGLSPIDLARALGVSESSVKRWIDAGRLDATRTPGGHRRVDTAAALRFVLESRRTVREPELLGLVPDRVDDAGELGERLFELLAAGSEAEAARLVLTTHVAGPVPVAELFDGALRDALRRVGELWDGAYRGVHVEHRAVRVLSHVLERLDAIHVPPAGAPVAVGGAVSGDPSLLPSRMAAIVLASEGWRAVDLGGDTPAEALLAAQAELGARLVWTSVGFAADPAARRDALVRLAATLRGRRVPLVLGGRELDRLELGPAQHVTALHDMRALADWARAARGNGHP